MYERNWILSVIFPWGRFLSGSLRHSAIIETAICEAAVIALIKQSRAATFKANKGIAARMSIFVEWCREQHGRRLYELILRRPDATVSLISFSFARISLRCSLARISRTMWKRGDENLRFVGLAMRNASAAVVFEYLSDLPVPNVGIRMYDKIEIFDRSEKNRFFCICVDNKQI